MSLAIDATVLILLQANVNQHLGVAELAARMYVSPDLVSDSLNRLEPCARVVVKRLAGLPFSAAALPKAKAEEEACA